MEIIGTRIEPAKGKAIKRLSEETYSLGATLLNGETEADFEEVDIEKALAINAEQEVEEAEKYGPMSAPVSEY